MHLPAGPASGDLPWGLAELLGIPGMRMCVPGQEAVSGVGWSVEFCLFELSHSRVSSRRHQAKLEGGGS